MTTTIQITKTGSDSYAFTTAIYNVAGGLGYISFSCNDEAFFEYFGGGVVFTKVDWVLSDTGATETALKYYDQDGIELHEAIYPFAMVKIIYANPQLIAKAIYQNITGQPYPGGDVSVIFPNNDNN